MNSPMRDNPLSTTEHRERRDQIRSAVLEDLAGARQAFLGAMQPDRDNVFAWRDEAFWVDRARMLVIPARLAAAWRSADTLPDDGEMGEATSLVEVFGGPLRFETSDQIMLLFAWLVRDVQAHYPWAMPGAHVLNLAVVQPVVNPAFGPLFWLALAHDLATPESSSNLYELVGPMLIDPGVPVELRPTAEVRTAQAALLEALAPGRPVPDARSLSEADWSRYCDAQLDAHREMVGALVFDDVWSRAGALAHEPGARPLPWE